MALQGDLKNMPLPDILQSLMLNRQTGILTLRDSGKEFFIFFNKEHISHVNPGKPAQEYLAPALATNAGISPEKLTQELKKRGKRSIADQMVKAGLFSAAAVQEIHRRFLTQNLYDVFAWKKGTFVFEPCNTPPVELFDTDQRGLELEVPIEQLMLESMQRIDEWKHIRRLIPTMDEILVVSDQFASQIIKVTEPDQTIVSLCDGQNSVSDIATVLGYDLFTVAKILSEYVKTHYIRRVKSDDLMLRADQRLDQSDKRGALKYLKKASEFDQANMEIRCRYAELCQELGMGTEAVNEYKILAQQARENELYDDAKAFYRKVISLSPTEHQIQKRLFEMLRLKSDPDTCKEGLVLAAILDQVGMLAEEVDALRLISGICPGDAAIRERTGALEASLGDQKSAFESYETAAELCLRSGDIQHACALYEKALENRPGDARVTSKIEELKSGLFLANREKRKKTVRLAIYSVAAALVLLFIAYQGISVSSYCTMRNKNLIFLTAGDPETACENTAHWERRFPLSLIRLDARRYVRIVRELQHAQITTQPDAFSPSVPAVEDSPGSASAPAATLAPDSMAPDQTRDSTTD